MPKIQKTISPTLRFGKYKLIDLVIPFLIVSSALFIKWENYFGDFGLGFRLLLFITAAYFWKLVKFLQNKVVRGFKGHILYKFGFKNHPYYPSNNQKEFIG